MNLKLKEFIEKPNYMYDSGFYWTTLKIYVPEGRGYNLSVDDILTVTNSNVLKGCEVRYVKARKNIPHNEMLKFMKSFDYDERVDNSSIDEKDTDNFRATLNFMRKKHREQYKQLKSDDASVGTVFIWKVVIKAESVELIEQQVEIILDNWKGVGDGNDALKYFMLIPYTGEQANSYYSMFDDLDIEDSNLSTSTQQNYAGLDFYTSSTLQDESGVMIGYDTFSTVKNTIIFDFVRSTKTQSCIAIPRNASTEFFSSKKNSKEIMPLSSVLSQCCANQFAMQGKKVVHIVLNEFDYEDTTNSELFFDDPKAIELIDVSIDSVNVIQAYGKVEEQKNIYQRMQQKLSLIFNILSDFTQTEETKTIIEAALRTTYKDARKWNREADKNPLSGKIVNQNPKHYPTIGDFGAKLESEMEKYLQLGLDELATKSQTTINHLDSIIDSNKTLLGRATTLKLPTATQTYYDFRNVGDKTMKMVQFVNIVNYISSELEEGDLIIIHGADILDGRIFNYYLSNEMNSIKKQGIKILYSFDVTTNNGNGGLLNLNEGRIYKDFDLDFDWSIIGRVEYSDTSKLEYLFNQSMTERMKVNIASQNVDGRVLIRRRSTSTLHFCDLLPFI